MDHYILDSNNAVITVTKYLGRTNAALAALGAAPLGTADGTATGEVGLKVLLVGGTSGALVLGALPAGTASIGGTKDNGPHWTAVTGVGGVAFTSADATTAAAVTDAPTTGQKLVITDLVVGSDTTMFLLFHEESTAGTVLFKVFISANTTVQITLRGRVKLPTVNKKLMVDASAAGNISVTASYFSEA